jgi:hypothetical protein
MSTVACPPTSDVSGRDLQRQLYVDFVEKPPLPAATICVSGSCQRGKLGLTASRGEDRRWEGNELRRFPQILGGGGQ